MPSFLPITKSRSPSPSISARVGAEAFPTSIPSKGLLPKPIFSIYSSLVLANTTLSAVNTGALPATSVILFSVISLVGLSISKSVAAMLSPA